MTLGNLLSPSEVHLLFELGLKDEMCRMPFTGFWKEVSERLASRAQRSRCSVARVQLGLSSTVQLIWAERKGKALGLEGSTGEEGAVDSVLRTQRHTVSRGRQALGRWERVRSTTPLEPTSQLPGETSRSPRRQGRASLSVGSESTAPRADAA